MLLYTGKICWPAADNATGPSAAKPYVCPVSEATKCSALFALNTATLLVLTAEGSRVYLRGILVEYHPADCVRVRHAVPHVLDPPGGNGISSRLPLKSPFPEDKMTRYSSLQYAALSPDPITTAARLAEEHCGSVDWVHFLHAKFFTACA